MPDCPLFPKRLIPLGISCLLLSISTMLESFEIAKRGIVLIHDKIKSFYLM